MKETLKRGDIVVFKAEDDILSKCIAWLTDSDASHAAMVYDKDSIIEVLADGANLHHFQPAEGESSYLLRLNPEADTAPLIRSADAYLNAGTRYDFPGLVLLGGLLVLRKIRPTCRLLTAGSRLLQAACLLLDKAIQKYVIKKPGPAMVCSQIVYQIYYDCGKEYQIQIKNGVFENDLTTDSVDGTQEWIRLCDFTAPDSVVLDTETVQMEDAFGEEMEQAVLQQFYDALTNSDTEQVDTVENHSILPAVHTFLSKVKKLQKLLHSDMPLDGLFVTPGDFVKNSENLKLLGTFDLIRK